MMSSAGRRRRTLQSHYKRGLKWVSAQGCRCILFGTSAIDIGATGVGGEQRSIGTAGTAG